MALTQPFCANGNKKPIPENMTGDGSVSYEQGFGASYALPPEEGGLFIDREQFNQLMFDTTSAVISNQNSITTLNSKVTANQNSINTLNSKVANIESGVATGVVNLTTNQTIDGIKTFSAPPVSATNPANNNQVANKAYVDTIATTLSNAGSKILTENLVKTVGASGADFTNLRQALEWASQYSYSGGRFTITLNCNADMPIPGVHLPFGEAKIVIDGQNNAFNCNNDYFMATNSSSQNVTIKNFILNFDTITNNVYGAAFQFTSTGVLLDNITININNSQISNVLIVTQGQYLNMQNTTINCIGNSIIATTVLNNGGELSTQDLVVNTAELNGQITNLFAFNKGYGNLFQYNAEKPAFSTDKITTQIAISQGTIVSCGNRFADNKLSSAPNTLTASGIIFKS